MTHRNFFHLSNWRFWIVFKLLGSCKINVQELTQARDKTSTTLIQCIRRKSRWWCEKANFETNKQKDINPFQDCRFIYQHAKFKVEVGTRGNSSNYLVTRICHARWAAKFVLTTEEMWSKLFICNEIHQLQLGIRKIMTSNRHET